MAKSEAILSAKFAVSPEGLFWRLRDFYIFFLTILIMDVPGIPNINHPYFGICQFRVCGVPAFYRISDVIIDGQYKGYGKKIIKMCEPGCVIISLFTSNAPF